MTCGIYKLNFANTDKVYIGQSLNIEKRYTEHISRLTSKTSSIKLNDAYALFGRPILEIIHTCTEQELDNFEDYFIEEYSSYTNGFNTCSSSTNKPDNTGTNNGMSVYSQESIVEVMRLINTSTLSYTKISNITNVDAGTIAQIAIGKRHSWLKTKFPIEYESMLLRPTSRTSISNSAEARGINYPLVVSTEGIVYEVVHLRNFAKEHSLDSGSLSRLLNRKAKSHKGWKLAEGELP